MQICLETGYQQKRLLFEQFAYSLRLSIEEPFVIKGEAIPCKYFIFCAFLLLKYCGETRKLKAAFRLGVEAQKKKNLVQHDNDLFKFSVA